MESMLLNVMSILQVHRHFGTKFTRVLYDMKPITHWINILSKLD